MTWRTNQVNIQTSVLLNFNFNKRFSKNCQTNSMKFWFRERKLATLYHAPMDLKTQPSSLEISNKDTWLGKLNVKFNKELIGTWSEVFHSGI